MVLGDQREKAGVGAPGTGENAPATLGEGRKEGGKNSGCS